MCTHLLLYAANEEERAVIDILHNERKSCLSISLILNRDHSGIAKCLKRRNEDKKKDLDPIGSYMMLKRYCFTGLPPMKQSVLRD